MLKAPFQLFASGVRAVETITALVMVNLLKSNVNQTVAASAPETAVEAR